MAALDLQLLRQTCRHFGLQPSYLSSEGETVWASAKTLQRILSDLTNEKVETDADLEQLLKRRKQEHFEQGLEIVHVAWNGNSPDLHLSTKSRLDRAKVRGRAASESGEDIHLDFEVIFQNDRKTILRWKQVLALGYYDLKITTPERGYESWIIAPPARLPDLPQLNNSWGPFFPLYALRSETDLGMGSIKELRDGFTALSEFGCKWVGTLPLLAGDFENPDCDPSPYSALTRLFWNEIYLDLDQSMNRYQCSVAQQEFNRPEFKKEAQRLRENSICDYYGVYQNKKKVIRRLSENFFEKNGETSKEYIDFKKSNPEIDSYSRFRSAIPEEQRFHQFVQFEMNRQLEDLKNKSKIGLYLDFPVGVNDAGFDFHEFREIFFAEVSVGAPPEPVFPGGQDWGFPSFHPERHRQSKYAYFRKSLRQHLKFSSILRLDHVMGLFRVYCVPKKIAPTDGVYLRYPPEELFAVAILEATRAGADFVGENLGTVPAAVESLMSKRNIKGMWVAQMQMEKDSDLTDNVTGPTMTCFNTHDMPTFTAFCKASDLDLMNRIGILSNDLKSKYLTTRAQAVSQTTQRLGQPLYENMLEKVLRSNSQYYVANMEDLWNEEQPQNIPGTFREYPIWRKKFQLPIEAWKTNREVSHRLDLHRKHRGSK